MNKIVREHYPVGRLPKDLRGDIAAGSSVKITVEEEPRREPISWQDMRLSLRAARKNAKGVTVEEAVARIRELRDEWDD